MPQKCHAKMLPHCFIYRTDLAWFLHNATALFHAFSLQACSISSFLPPPAFRRPFYAVMFQRYHAAQRSSAFSAARKVRATRHAKRQRKRARRARSAATPLRQRRMPSLAACRAFSACAKRYATAARQLAAHNAVTLLAQCWQRWEAPQAKAYGKSGA